MVLKLTPTQLPSKTTDPAGRNLKPINQPSGGVDKELNKKVRECIANGGKWVGNECIMPTPEIDPELEKRNIEQDTSKFGAFRDAETGRLSGFEQGGKTYLGVSPEEAKFAIEAEAGKQELQVGGQAEAVLQRRREELQGSGLDLSAQVGQDPMQKLQSQFSAQQVDYVGALASAVPGIIPDLLTGGAAFAGSVYGAGTVATIATGGTAAPVAAGTIAGAAVIGAVLNGVRGFYADFVSDIKRQKSELIETPIRTLTETKSIMNDIIGAQNSNPADATDNLEAFNSQLQLLDDEYDRLKDLTDDDLNKFLGDTGINQLQEYEVYYVANGERDRQIAEMQVALANPDPTKINPSTTTIKQINKRIEEEIKKLNQ